MPDRFDVYADNQLLPVVWSLSIAWKFEKEILKFELTADILLLDYHFEQYNCFQWLDTRAFTAMPSALYSNISWAAAWVNIADDLSIRLYFV